MKQKVSSRLWKIVAAIKENKPETVGDLNKLNIKTKLLGEGCYRKAYKIVGLPVVVKFPINNNKTGKNHTIAEDKSIRTIKRFVKYRPIRDFMPMVYHCDYKTGVIVMHYYKPIKTRSTMIAGLIEKISDMCWDRNHKSWTDTDIHGANIGVDENGALAIIDLGYFLPLGKGE